MGTMKSCYVHLQLCYRFSSAADDAQQIHAAYKENWASGRERERREKGKMRMNFNVEKAEKFPTVTTLTFSPVS